LGARGERAASRTLRAQGYELLASNLRLVGAEADLVLLSPNRRTIVIVEVKSLSPSVRHPLDRIDAAKRRHLRRLGAALLQRPEHSRRGVRFDVVAVRRSGRRLEVEHHPGAWE